jgi:hypothetical protein
LEKSATDIHVVASLLTMQAGKYSNSCNIQILLTRLFKVSIGWEQWYKMKDSKLKVIIPAMGSLLLPISKPIVRVFSKHSLLVALILTSEQYS